ncbi:MAG: hypothetical protein COB07_12060 [Sulfurovum sp.]|nr:MAG: hypothetical protein COB07_12060 [Sulfurovum sp.]
MSNMIKRTLLILEAFHKRKTLDSYDEALLGEFGIDPRQLGRLLSGVEKAVDSIEIIKTGRRKSYRLIESVDIFTEIIEKSNDIGWLFNMAYDSDPTIFKDLEKFSKKDKDIYLFKNTPFEDTTTLEAKETFKRLKTAVEHREYRKITFKGSVQDNLKCLKMVYMENNWYIAYVNSNDKLLFSRISFIKSVDDTAKMGSFQRSTVQKHLKFLENIQNSMTLYGKTKKTATIKAIGNARKYFDEGVKLRLSSQKFVKKLDDGSIIFTVEYTQAMEVLPLIQGWLPNLIILEPEDLKEYYIERLHQTIDNH